MHLTRIVVFVIFWAVFSVLLVRFIREKKPEVEIYDPEVIFPSVLIAAVLTRLTMLALTSIMAVNR
ncbi:MAG TPA: hypothetical protein PK926_00925 [Spirochaetota bacterium]|nr:hypothetical protein [Spirochaetota bacterium]HPI87911.1 hypothetical protein [Spirochaetota bacterium]HPR47357.1 hypothetical protein [Spirochaetota bacterium]